MIPCKIGPHTQPRIQRGHFPHLGLQQWKMAPRPKTKEYLDDDDTLPILLSAHLTRQRRWKTRDSLVCATSSLPCAPTRFLRSRICAHHAPSLEQRGVFLSTGCLLSMSTIDDFYVYSPFGVRTPSEPCPMVRVRRDKAMQHGDKKNVNSPSSILDVCSQSLNSPTPDECKYDICRQHCVESRISEGKIYAVRTRYRKGRHVS